MIASEKKMKKKERKKPNIIQNNIVVVAMVTIHKHTNTIVHLRFQPKWWKFPGIL